jgi:hypothetical protein
LKTNINIMSWHIVGFLLTASLLAGCLGIKPYPNTIDKNLHILTETNTGSFFSKVRAAIDIYRVDANCKTEYEGTVQLNEPSIDVGIPSHRLSYLVFVFSTSSFLAGSSSTISHDTLLKPRAGYNYDIKVSYIDNIYNVTIRETHLRTSATRDIVLKDLSDCGAFIEAQ